MSHMLPHLPQNTSTRSLSPTSLVFRPASPSLSCPTSAALGSLYVCLSNEGPPFLSPRDAGPSASPRPGLVVVDHNEFPQRRHHLPPAALLDAIVDDIDAALFLCTYTHLLHAHFSAHSACTVTFAHFSCVSHTRMAQGHEKFVCCMCVISLHLAFSLLMFHPSLLFLHTHLDITFLSVFLPNFPVLKAQDMRNSAHASRRLATWPSQMQTHVMSPRSSTRSLLWTVTRCALTIQTSMKSLTSRKTHTKTLDCSVFSQCLNPLFRTFLMMILLFR